VRLEKLNERIGFDVSRETFARLEGFVTLLQSWNARLNLVAGGEMPRIWERHIVDSLQLAPLIPFKTNAAIDLGSGAGFPGLPLSLVTQLPFALVEADHRKAAFLREAARVTGAPVTTYASRAETLAMPKTPLVTARALAPLPRLLPLVARFLAPGGACLLLKGARAEAELTAAAREWHMRVERFPSRTDPSGVVLRISELSRVQANPSQDPGDRQPEGGGRQDDHRH
jgi:16S rRNA (guanine527-N7)-methyltransferase